MPMIRLFFAGLFVLNFAYACPELQGVDLADGEGPWVHEDLGSSTSTLTEEEFFKIPHFADSSYEECKDALRVKEVKSVVTGRVFNALITSEDYCDGGNSYGALFSEDMQTRLGDIGDSYISCY
jgi:hypothetical protein